MKYVNVNEIAAKWNLSERSVRNYCAHGKIPGVILDGKTWRIPEDAVKPVRKKRAEKIANDLLTRLKMEKEAGIQGGIYHKVQIELTYNSNHMEGSRLTHDQTRYIFETNTIGIQDEVVNVDDIVETANHFRCIDQIIELANYPLSEAFIKQLHYILKSGTSDSRKTWFAVGEYKRFENEVGGSATAKPADVSGEMRNLLKRYNLSKQKTLKEIIQFHYEFEKIHPFQDGNGRMARLWHTVMLYRWRNVFEYIPLESQIERFQAEYYDAIAQCHVNGNSDVFIEFMLSMIDQALDEVILQVNKTNESMSEYVKRMLEVMEYDVPYTANAIMEALHLKSKETFRKNYIKPAIELGLVKMTLPEKPNSKNQRYVKQ